IGVVSTGEESAADGSSSASGSTNEAAAPGTDEKMGQLLADRKARSDKQVSRSIARPVALSVQRKTKTEHLPVSRQEMSGQVTESVEATDPRDIAIQMMADYGWGMDEFSCLDSLYVSESNWDHTATNPYSGAYGIPQSLPAEKMVSAGADWRTNPATQIEWGLDYIRSSYGTPCSAWSFKQGNNWY
ncbi:MAG: lytic transglycosylase domain-containing protein, partial [Nocardioidaceae bacterium]